MWRYILFFQCLLFVGIGRLSAESSTNAECEQSMLSCDSDTIITNSDMLTIYPNSNQWYTRGSLLDNMNKIPGLYISPDKRISALSGREVLIYINGIYDRYVNYNTLETLGKIPIKHLKSIEVDYAHNFENGIGTIVDVRPMPFKENFMVIAHAHPTSNDVRFGLTAYLNYNRFTWYISAAQYFRWNFHNTSKSTEDRRAANSYNQFISNSKELTNHRRQLSIEGMMTYNFNENTMFSTYVRVIPTNEHKVEIIDNEMFSERLLLYKYQNITNQNFDKTEFSAEVSFERYFSGYVNDIDNLTVKYNFDSAPTDQQSELKYSNWFSDSDQNDNTRFAPIDYTYKDKIRQYKHQVEVVFTPKITSKGYLLLNLWGKYDYLSDIKSNIWNQVIDEITPPNYTRPSQLQKRDIVFAPQIGYISNISSKLDIDLRLKYSLNRNLNRSLISGNKNYATYHYLLPYIDISYRTLSHLRTSFSFESTVDYPRYFDLSDYKDRSIMNHVTTGNLWLKPQLNHDAYIRAEISPAKPLNVNTKIILRYNNTHNYIENYLCLQNGILYRSPQNMGDKNDISLYLSFSKSVYDAFRFEVEFKGSYIKYNAPEYGLKKHGYFIRPYVSAEYETKNGYSFSLSGHYHTDYIDLQGQGGATYDYKCSMSKSFCNKRLMLNAYIANFLPIWKTINYSYTIPEFSNKVTDKIFNLSGGFKFQYTFGSYRSRIKLGDSHIGQEDI